MPLQSSAGNAIAADLTAKMVGFTAFADETPLSIYDFLFQPIRDADASQGQLLLKRWLEGPQRVWADIIEGALAVPSLWSVTEAPDAALPFLQWIAGWTSELSDITGRLTPLQLRRLLDASPTIWNQRGASETWVSVVSLLTGARALAYTWLDARYILDETATTEERAGFDTWLLDPPGVSGDEYESNLRVADDGTGALDRKLVLDVLEVLRPIGEKILVSWVSFIDEFNDDGDVSQWVAGATANTLPVVAGGTASLSNTAAFESAFAVSARASQWADSITFARVKGDGVFGVVVHATMDDLGGYKFELDVPNNRVAIRKVLVGAETPVAVVAMPAGRQLYTNVFYGLRAVAEGATLSLYLDGELLATAVDPDLVAGTAGLFHDVGGHVVADTFEVSPSPMDSSLVEP